MFLNNFSTDNFENDSNTSNLSKFKANNPKTIHIDELINRNNYLRKKNYLNKVTNIRNSKLASLVLSSNLESSEILTYNTEDSNDLFNQGLIISKSTNINHLNLEILKKNNLLADYSKVKVLDCINFNTEKMKEFSTISNLVKTLYETLTQKRSTVELIKLLNENNFHIFIFKTFNYTSSHLMSIWKYLSEFTLNQNFSNLSNYNQVNTLKSFNNEFKKVLQYLVILIDISMSSYSLNNQMFNSIEELFEYEIPKGISYLLNNINFLNDENIVENLISIVTKLCEDCNEFRDVFLLDFDITSSLINLCCLNEDMELIKNSISNLFTKSINDASLASSDYSKYNSIMSFQEKTQFITSKNQDGEIKSKNIKYNSLLCICSILGCQPTPKLLRVSTKNLIFR
jgi:hypothetical protein